MGGLEVQGLDGSWIEAKPMKGTIVVNIGDLLQFWSDNRYRATPHRVKATQETSLTSRYSIALFVHPNHDVDISPIKNKKEENGGETMTMVTASQHVKKRFRETYK